jgi:hypothetical protein
VAQVISTVAAWFCRGQDPAGSEQVAAGPAGLAAEGSFGQSTAQAGSWAAQPPGAAAQRRAMAAPPPLDGLGPPEPAGCSLTWQPPDRVRAVGCGVPGGPGGRRAGFRSCRGAGAPSSLRPLLPGAVDQRRRAGHRPGRRPADARTIGFAATPGQEPALVVFDPAVPTPHLIRDEPRSLDETDPSGSGSQPPGCPGSRRAAAWGLRSPIRSSRIIWRTDTPGRPHLPPAETRGLSGDDPCSSGATR